ncbi:MAG: hypothetical protein O3A92_15225 [Verrucomicrobia bacterium]|nr:hypothetical protein [Verrucomicrobiota bacterium]
MMKSEAKLGISVALSARSSGSPVRSFRTEEFTRGAPGNWCPYLNFLRNPMQVVAIILASVAAAIVYGIIHDQVIARICVEYFTIVHPD